MEQVRLARNAKADQCVRTVDRADQTASQHIRTAGSLPCIPGGERERLQCFSQPASLITYRRRQRSNVENIKTVQNELENLHMILLRKKGSHGVCVRGKQRSIPLPNCLESWTLKNYVQFICNSHTTTMCADPIGSGNMLTPSKTPENDWQLMRAQPKL